MDKFKKLAIALVLTLAGAGGADAAGYTPDLDDVSKGIGGTLLLIAYLELRAMPVMLRIAARDKAEAAKEVEAAIPAPLVETKSAPLSKPRIAVVRHPTEEA